VCKVKAMKEHERVESQLHPMLNYVLHGGSVQYSSTLVLTRWSPSRCGRFNRNSEYYRQIQLYYSIFIDIVTTIISVITAIIRYNHNCFQLLEIRPDDGCYRRNNCCLTISINIL
jgi:hypothetical protein